MTFASRQREYDQYIASCVASADVIYNSNGLEIRSDGVSVYLKSPRINSEPRWVVFHPATMDDSELRIRLKNSAPDWYDNHFRADRNAVITAIRGVE